MYFCVPLSFSSLFGILITIYWMTQYFSTGFGGSVYFLQCFFLLQNWSFLLTYFQVWWFLCHLHSFVKSILWILISLIEHWRSTISMYSPSPEFPPTLSSHICFPSGSSTHFIRCFTVFVCSSQYLIHSKLLFAAAAFFLWLGVTFSCFFMYLVLILLLNTSHYEEDIVVSGFFYAALDNDFYFRKQLIRLAQTPCSTADKSHTSA